MILTNIDYVPGYEVAEALNLVKGSTIRAKHLGKDLKRIQPNARRIPANIYRENGSGG